MIIKDSWLHLIWINMWIFIKLMLNYFYFIIFELNLYFLESWYWNYTQSSTILSEMTKKFISLKQQWVWCVLMHILSDFTIRLVMMYMSTKWISTIVENHNMNKDMNAMLTYVLQLLSCLSFQVFITLFIQIFDYHKSLMI